MGWEKISDQFDILLSPYKFKGVNGYVILNASSHPIPEGYYNHEKEWDRIKKLKFKITGNFKTWIEKESVIFAIQNWNLSHWISPKPYDPLYKWEMN